MGTSITTQNNCIRNPITKGHIKDAADRILSCIRTRIWNAAAELRSGELLRPRSGAGVVELVLIIVVLISLVLIFKSQLTSLMRTIFAQIDSSATSVF